MLRGRAPPRGTTSTRLPAGAMVRACARDSAAGAVKLKDLTARQVQKAPAELSVSLPACSLWRLCSAPGLKDRSPTGNSSTGGRSLIGVAVA